jgi:hypothetical protein
LEQLANRTDATIKSLKISRREFGRKIGVNESDFNQFINKQRVSLLEQL